MHTNLVEIVAKAHLHIGCRRAVKGIAMHGQNLVDQRSSPRHRSRLHCCRRGRWHRQVVRAYGTAERHRGTMSFAFGGRSCMVGGLFQVVSGSSLKGALRQAMRMLDDVREFVGRQPITAWAARPVIFHSDRYVGPGDQRSRGTRRVDIVGGWAGVDAHRGRVERERALPWRQRGSRKRRPASRGGASQVVFDLRRLLARRAVAGGADPAPLD
jgi:hypothetical protein